MRQTKSAKKVAKRKKTAPVRSGKQSIAQLEMDERLAACGRGDVDQILFIGNLVERSLQGGFGDILRALIRGRMAGDLQESRQHGGTLSADRYLGRLDAYDRILEDLERYVMDRDAAFSKLRQKSTVRAEEHATAESPGEETVLA